MTTISLPSASFASIPDTPAPSVFAADARVRAAVTRIWRSVHGIDRTLVLSMRGGRCHLVRRMVPVPVSLSMSAVRVDPDRAVIPLRVADDLGLLVRAAGGDVTLVSGDDGSVRVYRGHALLLLARPARDGGQAAAA